MAIRRNFQKNSFLLIIETAHNHTGPFLLVIRMIYLHGWEYLLQEFAILNHTYVILKSRKGFCLKKEFRNEPMPVKSLYLKEMMKKMRDFIEHCGCPLLDGIIFPDETIQLLDVEWNGKFPGYEYKIQVASKTTITALNNADEIYWTTCGSMAKLIDKTVSLEVRAGEGSYGSDGFAAVIDLKTRKLMWIAYFTDSNPFYKLRIDGEDLYATSTYNCVWKFDLKNPALISVDCSDAY